MIACIRAVRFFLTRGKKKLGIEMIITVYVGKNIDLRACLFPLHARKKKLRIELIVTIYIGKKN
jgi:hypothetical protein